MQEEGSRFGESEVQGGQTEEGDGQDKKTKNREPEQVEREPERRASEDVENQRQRGKLSRHGTPQSEPEETQDGVSCPGGEESCSQGEAR